MKLKDDVQIDVLKKYGFQLAEHNQETGFKRYHKHYGSFLMTICNNRLEKQIHLSLQESEQSTFAGKRVIASIHQINKDLCLMASKGLIEFVDEVNEMEETQSQASINDWDAQMAQHNPFAFLMD